MQNEHEDKDKVKRDRGGTTANTEPPQPTRRQLLKGLTTGTVALGALSPSVGGAAVPPLKTHGATDTTTVCPFCGVGCGQVVSTRNGHVINIEGDAGHPISEGTLCSKGAAGADGDETGAFFISLLSLVKEALRRICRCCKTREMLLPAPRSGAGA